jgi:hypothetical protein
MPRAVLKIPSFDFPMNVFDLRPRSPADFDAIPLVAFFKEKRNLTVPLVTLRDV